MYSYCSVHLYSLTNYQVYFFYLRNSNIKRSRAIIYNHNKKYCHFPKLGFLPTLAT
jgi:hypothetical protein